MSIPTEPDLTDISQLIDEATGKDPRKINDFLFHLKEIDKAVEEAFGFTSNENTFLHKRLQSFPFLRLIPRYPWEEGAHHQATRTYDTDRFE